MKKISLIKLIERLRDVKSRSIINLSSQKGQSTLEYALVLIVAAIISGVLVAIGKPMLVDIISKVFSKIASMV
ncbi:MAG: hypothetical protein H5T85_09395 [Actinobacteria bacterium]|nr:hypothetical protein [Actinomycetota bacterium]